jgi:hypothetical protein
MSYVLHLGHQPHEANYALTNFAQLSTDAGGFDPLYDVNALRLTATINQDPQPFSVVLPAAPVGDLWLGFRLKAPSNLRSFTSTVDDILFYDLTGNLVAKINTLSSSDTVIATAVGNSTVAGSSSFLPVNGQTFWVDVRVAVGANITIDFYVDGALRSTATASNSGGKSKPVRVDFRLLGIIPLSSSATQYIYVAHLAVLDNVSTIGRRFLRKRPNIAGAVSQMSGSVSVLADGDLTTRMESTGVGQRQSFTLTGPGLAAGASLAAVHVKAVAQRGNSGPTECGGFLRIGGVNYDGGTTPVSDVAPQSVYTTFATNPATGAPWSQVTAPSEVGIISA